MPTDPYENSKSKSRVCIGLNQQYRDHCYKAEAKYFVNRSLTLPIDNITKNIARLRVIADRKKPV